MSYASIDPQIRDWAAKHALKLFTSWADHAARFIYVSSVTGDCFQIWIDPPEAGQVSLHAAFVDGPRDEDLNWDCHVPESDLASALEQTFSKVTDWMKPSERYYPDPSEVQR